MIDVGGGASRLVDHLLDRGYTDVTVVDLAASALDASRERLGARADLVTWIVDDVLRLRLGHTVAVWHDRAVFHFLTDASHRADYVDRVRATLRPGGHVVVATFGPDGLTTCSGLPTGRYDADEPAASFGNGFVFVDAVTDEHVSPTGVTQQFVSVVLRRADRIDSPTAVQKSSTSSKRSASRFALVFLPFGLPYRSSYGRSS